MGLERIINGNSVKRKDKEIEIFIFWVRKVKKRIKNWVRKGMSNGNLRKESFKENEIFDSIKCYRGFGGVKVVI